MDFEKIISVIGVITPVLVVAMFFIAGYNVLNPMVPLSEVNQYNDVSRTPTGSWWFDAITYAGFTLAQHSLFINNGSESARQSIVRRGAIYGGLIIMIIMLLINFGVLSIIPNAMMYHYRQWKWQTTSHLGWVQPTQ